MNVDQQRDEIKLTIAKKLYTITATQLCLANYFSGTPVYHIDWESLADCAKGSWIDDAQQLMDGLNPLVVIPDTSADELTFKMNSEVQAGKYRLTCKLKEDKGE